MYPRRLGPPAASGTAAGAGFEHEPGAGATPCHSGWPPSRRPGVATGLMPRLLDRAASEPAGSPGSPSRTVSRGKSGPAGLTGMRTDIPGRIQRDMEAIVHPGEPVGAGLRVPPGGHRPGQGRYAQSPPGLRSACRPREVDHRRPSDGRSVPALGADRPRRRLSRKGRRPARSRSRPAAGRSGAVRRSRRARPRRPAPRGAAGTRRAAPRRPL